MVDVDRRQALMTAMAAGAGVLAGGVPTLVRAMRPTPGHKTRKAARAAHLPPRDPGYAHGAPMRALNYPVHNLLELSPPAPPNSIALTIDDGPQSTYTPMMLDLLAEFRVPATFSLIGEQVTELPKLVQRITQAGHQISDHTITHPLNLPSLSAANMKEEIAGAHDRIAQTTGIAPKFFRSPGGNWSQQVMEIAGELGMICIDWQVDPRDWARPGTSRIADVMLQAKAGDILLCHDGGGDRSETIQALRTVIPALQRRGLTFVAL